MCLICIHWEGGPFKTPKFANLPSYVTESNLKPFTNVGVDYLGPLLVKNEECLKKNWICLFTCLNVRGIHLELVGDMTTHSFLMGFRRFIARRGKPTMVIRDNGSQLKLGYDVIQMAWEKVVRNEEFLSYVNNERINWKFINEYSPWQGGFYERLIGMVKRSLKKTLQKAKVY